MRKNEISRKSVPLVQHCSGKPGSGGPAVAYERLKQFLDMDFVEIRQVGRGGIGTIIAFLCAIKRARPKLVHVRGLGMEGFYAAVASWLAGVPLVLVSIHGTHRDLVQGRAGIKRKLTILAEDITLRLASHIVPVSGAMAGRQYLRRHRHKVQGVISNGVPVNGVESRQFRQNTRARLGIPSDQFVFVTVMRVTYEKGSDLLFDNLKKLDDEGLNFTFLIVGDGDRLSLFSRYDFRFISVICVGRQKYVYPFLGAADAFVLPSLHENSSNALLEAMASELPCIVSRVGGNIDVINNSSIDSFFVNVDFDLANVMRGIVNSPSELLVRKGRDARNVALAKYSVERMCSDWISLYRKIIEGRD